MDNEVECQGCIERDDAIDNFIAEAKEADEAFEEMEELYEETNEMLEDARLPIYVRQTIREVLNARLEAIKGNPGHQILTYNIREALEAIDDQA